MLRHKAARRHFFIYPNFQLAMLTINFVVVMAAAGYIGWSARTSFSKIKTIGVQMHLWAHHPFYKAVEVQAQNFYSHLFIGLLIALAVSSAVTLILSQRLAGPVLRLKHYMDKINSRQKVPAKPLKFRKGDFFPDLPGTFNGAVTSLKKGQLLDDETTTSFILP
jgi:hypothetical protein